MLVEPDREQNNREGSERILYSLAIDWKVGMAMYDALAIAASIFVNPLGPRTLRAIRHHRDIAAENALDLSSRQSIAAHSRQT